VRKSIKSGLNDGIGGGHPFAPPSLRLARRTPTDVIFSKRALFDATDEVLGMDT
jgi:hypothetical protein